MSFYPGMYGYPAGYAPPYGYNMYNQYPQHKPYGNMYKGGQGGNQGYQGYQNYPGSQQLGQQSMPSQQQTSGMPEQRYDPSYGAGSKQPITRGYQGNKGSQQDGAPAGSQPGAAPSSQPAAGGQQYSQQAPPGYMGFNPQQKQWN